MSPYDPVRAHALCYQCPLAGTSKVVPPKGPPDADVVIVGEAPGRFEEMRGEPFVGASGVLLDELLHSAGLKRDRCWISNVLNCRAVVPDMEGAGRYDLKTYLAWIRKENAKRKKAAKLSKTEFVPIHSPIDCCRPRLLAELKWFEQVHSGRPNGAVVIALGGFALKALTGKEGILKWRGSPLFVEI